MKFISFLGQVTAPAQMNLLQNECTSWPLFRAEKLRSGNPSALVPAPVTATPRRGASGNKAIGVVAHVAVGGLLCGGRSHERHNPNREPKWHGAGRRNHRRAAPARFLSVTSSWELPLT